MSGALTQAKSGSETTTFWSFRAPTLIRSVGG